MVCQQPSTRMGHAPAPQLPVYVAIRLDAFLRVLQFTLYRTFGYAYGKSTMWLWKVAGERWDRLDGKWQGV